MAFGIKKKSGAKKKEKGGLLATLGVKAEKAPTAEDSEDRAMNEAIKKAWGYLRRQIDRGVQEYFTGDDTNTLREYVASPALENLLTELESLRSKGIHWSQPDRATRTEPRFTIVRKRLNNQGQPVQFVVQERFRDYSVYRSLDGRSERVAEGEEKVFQATVEVEGGQSYKLLSIIKVHGATL